MQELISFPLEFLFELMAEFVDMRPDKTTCIIFPCLAKGVCFSKAQRIPSPPLSLDFLYSFINHLIKCPNLKSFPCELRFSLSFKNPALKCHVIMNFDVNFVLYGHVCLWVSAVFMFCCLYMNQIIFYFSPQWSPVLLAGILASYIEEPCCSDKWNFQS